MRVLTPIQIRGVFLTYLDRDPNQGGFYKMVGLPLRSLAPPDDARGPGVVGQMVPGTTSRTGGGLDGRTGARHRCFPYNHLIPASQDLALRRRVGVYVDPEQR
jgi:hypothetical protein